MKIDFNKLTIFIFMSLTISQASTRNLGRPNGIKVGLGKNSLTTSNYSFQGLGRNH